MFHRSQGGNRNTPGNSYQPQADKQGLNLFNLRECRIMSHGSFFIVLVPSPHSLTVRLRSRDLQKAVETAKTDKKYVHTRYFTHRNLREIRATTFVPPTAEPGLSREVHFPRAPLLGALLVGADTRTFSIGVFLCGGIQGYFGESAFEEHDAALGESAFESTMQAVVAQRHVMSFEVPQPPSDYS